MISMSLIDPLKPETPVGVELGFVPAFVAIELPPLPQAIKKNTTETLNIFLIFQRALYKWSGVGVRRDGGGVLNAYTHTPSNLETC